MIESLDSAIDRYYVVRLSRSKELKMGEGRREKGEGKVVMYSRIVLVIPKGTASHCVWYNPTESDTVRYTYLRDIRVIFSMKPPRARVLPIDRCE